MTIEWLRRHDGPDLDRHLRTYLFSEELDRRRGAGRRARRRLRRRTPVRTAHRSRRQLAWHRESPREHPMNHLLRPLAPITETAWKEIEDEAKRSLDNFLASRRLVRLHRPAQFGGDWRSPSARSSSSPAPRVEGVEAAHREVQRLIKLRARFTLPSTRSSTRSSRRHVAPISTPSSMRPVASPAPRTRSCSTATRRRTSSVSPRRHRTRRLTSATASVVPEVGGHGDCTRLRDAGVEGPYGITLGPRCYAGILETTEDGGYPVARAAPSHPRWRGGVRTEPSTAR